MPKISVITPTIRPSGLDLVFQSLKAQSEQDFEWLIDVSFPQHHEHGDLNASYNRLIRRSQGELIISLQDFIHAPPNLLERAWEEYQAHPDTFYTVPVGKTSDFKKVEYDIRANPECRQAWTTEDGGWRRWEIDCGFASKEALYKVGGFDENLDKFTWSGDNVVVGWKAHTLGYKFDVMQDVKCIAYDHDAKMPHPFRGPKQRLDAVGECMNDWNINKTRFLS